jgi:hypothetical protein
MPMVHRLMPFAIGHWQAGNKEELFNVLSVSRKILGVKTKTRSEEEITRIYFLNIIQKDES